MNSIKKYIITLSALTFILVGCKGKEDKAGATAGPSTIEEIQKEKGKPARVAKAKKSSLKDIREFSGTVEGMQQTNAISKMGDPLEKIYVQVGSTVKTQKLFNTLYAHTAEGTTCVPDDVAEALEYIIKTQSYSYEEVLFRLPERQKQVLIALAKSGPTKSITSASFLQANALPSASMVQSAVRGLLEKDYITLFHGVYSVYDLFLDYWIQREL